VYVYIVIIVVIIIVESGLVTYLVWCKLELLGVVTSY